MPEEPEIANTTHQETAAPPRSGGPLVPVPLPVPQIWVPVPFRRRRLKLLLAMAVLLLGAGGGVSWWLASRPALPPGIASGNGRIEADEIDIDTKFAGRIARLLADEGDMVHAGQVVAVMDTQDLDASLRRAEAVVRQSQRALDEAHANVAQQQSQVQLARLELERARYLLQKKDVSKEIFDQRQQQMDGSVAALAAATAKVGEAEHALDAATHDVELYKVNIADNTLVAPRDGRVQYRIANIGEVLPAGGKVFTMLDTSYVYMDIYLPTADAGRVGLGADGRIVLDAFPNFPIPAKVTFLATQAQFTPKAVETKSERDKLMFRVKLRIDPELLRAHAEAIRTGLPGIAYVKTDPSVAWPEPLKGDSRP
jgi:HlyD family secretion protein